MATNAVALRGRRALRFAVDRLSFAITQGDTEEFVRLLKKEAADLHEAFDRDGLSPLHVTVMSCNSHQQWRKMSFTLLFYRERLNLDVNIQSRDPRTLGWTALDFAYMYNPRAVKVLQRHGCMATSSSGGHHHLRLQVYMDYSQILRILFPSPHAPPLFQFERPQSIKPSELSSQFLIGALLHYQAIFEYRPLGALNDIRYCFPACFPLQLPSNEWSETMQYIVYVGRFLTSLASKLNLLKILLQLLVRVLSEIDDKPSVSKSSFCFRTPKGTQCCVAVLKGSSSTSSTGYTGDGIRLLFRSNTSIPDTYNICGYIIQLAYELSHSAFSIDVLSSSDLRNGEPHPHVYSSAEVKKARATNKVLVHPRGWEESFLNLVLEPSPQPHGSQAETPIKHVPRCCSTPSPKSGSCFTPKQMKLNVVRKLQYCTYPSDYSWSVEVCEKAVFSCCYEELVKYMQPESLVPALVTKGYLTPEEAAVVVSPGATTSTQAVMLLSFLKRSLQTMSDFYQFFKILREEVEHKAHEELEKSIVKACEEIADASSSLTPAQSWELPPATTSYHSTPHSQDPGFELPGDESQQGCHHASSDSGIHSKPSTGERHSDMAQFLQRRPRLQVNVNESAGNFSNKSHKSLTHPLRRVCSPITIKVSKGRSSRRNSQNKLRETLEVEGEQILPKQLSSAHLTDLMGTTFEMSDIFNSRPAPPNTSNILQDTAREVPLSQSGEPRIPKLSPIPSSPRDIPGSFSRMSSTSEQSDSSRDPSPYSLSRTTSVTSMASTGPPAEDLKVLEDLKEPWSSKVLQACKEFFIHRLLEASNEPPDSLNKRLPGFGFRM